MYKSDGYWALASLILIIYGLIALITTFSGDGINSYFALSGIIAIILGWAIGADL